MDQLAEALADAGGLAAPRERSAQLRHLAAAELTRSRTELALARSGYEAPVTVLLATREDGALAALPLDPALRADPAAVTERGWLLAAATLGALVEAGAAPPVEAGATGAGALVLRLAVPPGREPPDPELAALAFEEQVASIDRLRARALAVPAHVLEDAADLRAPVGATHPLTVAAHIAALGGRPADPHASEEHEDAVLAMLAGDDHGVARPHDDPDPTRRAARRILQRLDGMGKWGGYHTEFAHLARGFPPAEQRLAADVGEALLAAGLLDEKPSVGQRHVFLNPRRAGDIHALIERGVVPGGLSLS